jgi:hypothetical protein
MKIEQFIEPDEIDKAYAAGFIDGEGYLGIVLSWHRKTYADGTPAPPAPRIQLNVGQDRKDPLEFIAYRWGGTLHENVEKTGHKFYRLNFSGIAAVKLCQDLLPYLIVKRSQAQHIILVAESCFFGERTRGQHGPRHTPEQKVAQLAAVEESKRLNARKEC